MKRLLHIVATPRDEESRTLRITEAFLEAFRGNHKDWVIEELNLSRENLPALTAQRADGKYALLAGGDLDGALKDAWGDIAAHIRRFLSADAYLISTPMWNFSIPYTLKQYIDIIVQPKYLFQYTTTGVEGLVKNRKMAVIISRGGEYISPQAQKFDFQAPYLRAIFGFTGITDISFIIAQPMDTGKELREEKIKEARAHAAEIAAGF